ncbi:MAG: cytochrome c3 family protein [bacterium]|jgi:predicted CXXCH cytochrome family protein|nr:cytochrome c3 family protein [bacterium]
MRLRRVLLLALPTVALPALVMLAGADGRATQPVNLSRVQASPHNLTHWHDGMAPDPSMERQLCRVCHGPRVHEQLIPLWDRTLPRGPFELGAHLDDDEPGFPADPGSQLCLACHDGGIARAFPVDPAEHISRETDLGERAEVAPTHMNTHLFSFNWSNRELVRPDSLATGMTLRGDRIRCSTCHDPHDNTRGNFLRVGAAGGEICLTCHRLESWSHSVHANPDDPLYAEMQDLSCYQCHSIHASPPQPGLLLAEENSLCFRCHDASVDGPREIASPQNLKREFDKLFTHPVSLHTGSGFIRPDESGFVGFLAGSRENRAVRCSDCHNPHAASAQSTVRTLPSSMEGVSGISRLGMVKPFADFEYEVCLKCHGFTSSTLPGQRDVARDFDLGNRSHHAVMGPGLNPEVPSLKPGWSPLDQLTCSDCHGNDDPHGPQGPHGSNIEHLLKAPFNPSPYLSGAAEENGLCFSCHRENWFTSGQGWRWHRLHILQGGYSCAACHDPHGSPDQPGLLRLDKPWIAPLNGVLKVERSSLSLGNCTLSCHGHPHRSAAY